MIYMNMFLTEQQLQTISKINVVTFSIFLTVYKINTHNQLIKVVNQLLDTKNS